MQYKVVVVDDSPFMRKIISDIIGSDPSFHVVGTAVNGIEAIARVSELKPDILTMDVEMPEMNGLEALKIIMKDQPIPIIMLSGINEEGLRETILALESGAFDFIRKPSASVSNDIVQVGNSLLDKMNAAMQAKERRITWEADELSKTKKLEETKQIDNFSTITIPKHKVVEEKNSSTSKPILKNKKLPLGKEIAPIQEKKIKPSIVDSLKKERLPKETTNTVVKPFDVTSQVLLDSKIIKDKVKSSTSKSSSIKDNANPRDPVSINNGSNNSFQHLIAIGCSTGGPRALKEVLERLPGDLPAPVIIVQHMPPKFTKSLAQRLNTFSALEVVEAEHGMVLNKGYAYVAPGGYHMIINKVSGSHYEVLLTEEEPCNGHRPSVETMFDSLLPFTMLERHVILLTGMGSDGAKAMKRLYDSGVSDTYAESEGTCVVYGMPRSAVELNCVGHILPIQEIPRKLIQMVKN
ncbi:hypothetical protein PNBC_04805 [Paenibacillus crassostreae]|uniref:Protein-glutamate methylesterase/protein-glutamine glutaminase n=2 Tax=Paenibacillus crassostreae TaxID=1763538 RepID=A0A167FMX6_9BACL|nr:hypothetical protein LPB68_19935 [Paenibacillus crassostreae]OAB76724.1 hypothetical protein PNBC_04805 [Paenibacillus crassostreae]